MEVPECGSTHAYSFLFRKHSRSGRDKRSFAFFLHGSNESSPLSLLSVVAWAGNFIFVIRTAVHSDGAKNCEGVWNQVGGGCQHSDRERCLSTRNDIGAQPCTDGGSRHGTANQQAVLRKACGEEVKVCFIQRFAPARKNFGGDGATVVRGGV